MDLAIDDDNNVYVLLSFYGVIDADRSATVYNIGVANELRTAILKYNVAGDLLMALVIEGSGSELVMDLGPQGEILVHNVYYNDTIDLNPQGGNLIYPYGAYNQYLLKLDAAGTFQ